jgi:heme ABC exporter ATP-binding subunit CcmA
MDGRPALGIALTQVSKAFGAQLALDHVDLKVDQGSFVAVMGANGAGKTTLLKVISGLAAPTSGSVRIAGIEMRKAGPKLRALVGVVSHETMLYADLTTEENLRFHAKLFGLRRPAEAVMRAVERLDVAHVLDKPVRALSRGTRQRVALARALLHDPAVILLDEPYTGLDEAAAATLTELLDELATPERILLLTLHDVVRAMSGPRRLVVLSAGRVALDEPIAGSTDRMAETYLGLLRAEARR